MTVASKINLLDLDRSGLVQYFAGRGEKAFRASQVMKWIHDQGVAEFAAMTNISKALRTSLEDEAEIRLPEIAADRLSEDGSRKWLFRLADGNCIETVFIPEADRGTLCISSQVGCMLNCSFCSTAQQGFNRNLTTAEIIGQLWLAARALGQTSQGERVVSNVVLMGMGEPLLNYDNVVRAIRIMLDDFAYGLSRRRVTLSTAGVVPAIHRLREDCDVKTWPCPFWQLPPHVDDDLADDLTPEQIIERAMGGDVEVASGAPDDAEEPDGLLTKERLAEFERLCSEYVIAREMEKEGKSRKKEIGRKLTEQITSLLGDVETNTFKVTEKDSTYRWLDEDAMAADNIQVEQYRRQRKTTYPLVTEKKK